MGDDANMSRGIKGGGGVNSPPNESLFTALWAGLCGLVAAYLKDATATALKLSHEGRDHCLMELNVADRTAIVEGPVGTLILPVTGDHVLSLYRQIARAFNLTFVEGERARDAPTQAGAYQATVGA